MATGAVMGDGGGMEGCVLRREEEKHKHNLTWTVGSMLEHLFPLITWLDYV